jgi:hypothetical protein
VVPLEKEVQAQIKQYLQLNGWLVLRLNSGAIPAEYKGKRRFIRFNDQPGCSDLLALKDGVAAFIECKRPGKKATAEQESFLEEVRKHGGIAFVADSLDSLLSNLQAFDL